MRQFVLLLFFFSGACGLVYQVVWVRMMTHVFGTTALAVGTVLAAFMSGLAAGGWLLGKAADRSHNPLRVYAYLELGVGLAALGAHLLLDRLTPIYLAIYEFFGRSDVMLGSARFILAFGLVMAPTFLMGGTLPVLVRFAVTRLSAFGTGLSALYAINTLGAVVGTLVTGFYLIGAHGIHRTIYLAVLANLGIGVVAWIASAHAVAASAAHKPPEKANPASKVSLSKKSERRIYRLLLVGFAISGFTSFAYEIYWTRSLVFLLGNSTYAVTTMLTAFLTGIALGGYLVRFIVDRLADRMAVFGWIQILIAVSSSAALPVLFAVAEPAALREFLIEASDNVALLIVSRFSVALLVMLVPATLIGATLPLVGRIAVLELQQAGSSVGRIYAVNTLGNVAGALLPGLLLLQWLGIQRGILAMAVLNACVGFTMLLSRPGRFTNLRWAVPVIFVAAALVLYRVPLEFQFPSRTQSNSDRVLFYKEGPSATTKVFINPDTREKSMSLDGVTIGGTGFADYKQQLLAHLPKLLVENFSVELSVGLGSAILVGESIRHPQVRKINCLEIEPSVVAGAAFFGEENHQALRDPRLQVIVDDILNYLRTTSDLYHVISADEKTQQDYASNGFSYSTEYYELLRRRLAPGGVVVQWVPTSLPPSQYLMVLKTFADIFPSVLVWFFPPALQEGPSNTILVGSNEKIQPDLDRMRRRLTSEPRAFDGLARYGLTTAEAVMAHFVTTGDFLRKAVKNAPVNTFDHPRYEFFSPQDYAVPVWRRLSINHDFIMDLRRIAAPPFLSAVASGADPTGKLEEAFAAEEIYAGAYRRKLAAVSEAEMFRRLESALALAPWNDSLRGRIFLHYWSAARTRYHQRAYRTAANFMERALSVYGKSALARAEYGIILLRIGATDRALAEARMAVSLDPRLVLARRMLADLLLKTGLKREAEEQLQALLKLEPDDAGAREMLSRL